MYVLLLLLLSSLGLFPAFVAHHKGHSFAVWWVYGAVAFIVALPHALLTANNNSLANESALHGGRVCPYCRETVLQEDDKCPSCHLHLYDPVQHGPPIGSHAENGQPHRGAADVFSSSLLIAAPAE